MSYVFFSELKEKMFESLSSLLKADFRDAKIDEAFWGPELKEESEEPLGSVFTVPLTISGKAAGLFSVASKKTAFYKEKEISALNRVAELSGQAVTRLQEVVEAEELKKPKSYQLSSVLPLVMALALISTVFDFIFFAIFYTTAGDNTNALVC